METLLDVKKVAELLGLSPRTIYRLTDSARMPKPLKIGAASRFRASEIRAWIEAGCPAVRGSGR
jgi:excisionase family DNA binding protein